MSGRRTRTLLLAAPEELTEKEQARRIARPLPDDCPVRALGMTGAATPTGVFLTASGTVAQMTGQQLGQGNLDGLFAPHNQWLWQHWPRIDKNGNLTNVRAELARVDLLAAAGARGIWDAQEKVRGAGAWRSQSGSLVLHLGDRVLADGRVQPWGELDGYVYPAAAAMLGPALAPEPDGAGNAAHELLALLHTWHWRHADVAPRLMLGWICAAMIGGALRWRPAVWPTGDRGTGKSSLIELIRGILGPNAAISTNNTTAAGIRQALTDRSVPVLLDELEAADDGGDAIHRVIELLRQASSGGVGLRGGADHKGAVFQIRSPMLAASIIVPPLRAQDRSRIAVLELQPLPEGSVAPAMTADDLHALGQRLLRRMVDGWAALPGRLETWRAELGTHARLDARGQDQYGTLLACADLALHNTAPDGDSLREIIGCHGDAPTGLCALLGDASADDVPDWRRCLDHILTSAAELSRGGDRLTLGVLVAQAADRRRGADAEAAQRALGTYGLRVLLERGTWQLAIANQHRQLAVLFERTIWGARSGATGGWRQTLLRAEGAWARSGGLRFDGLQSKVVCVPVAVALNDDRED